MGRKVGSLPAEARASHWIARVLGAATIALSSGSLVKYLGQPGTCAIPLLKRDRVTELDTDFFQDREGCPMNALHLLGE